MNKGEGEKKGLNMNAGYGVEVIYVCRKGGMNQM